MISANINETDIHIGDTIKVSSSVVEGTKTRIQIFEGIVISLSGRGENRMITVRKVSVGGFGVERKWPLNSKSIVKVEVKKHAANVRRAKLYYLRERTGKQAVNV